MTITDHAYDGTQDGLHCNYDYGDIDLVDFCSLPRSAHFESTPHDFGPPEINEYAEKAHDDDG